MLNSLGKLLESEKKDKSIIDIIAYGSSVKGKDTPSDIDIMILFADGSLRERLNKLQDIKTKIKTKMTEKVDVKQMLLKDFFDSAFLARTGILLEGVSIFNGNSFSETLGFKSYALFWYNLANLNHTQKVIFNYILAGRKRKGVIEELEGIRISNGAIKIPIKNSLTFEKILQNNNISFNKKNILEEA
jgi:predicted nucleotidyltransferase